MTQQVNFYDFKSARKAFSRIGISLVLFFLTTTLSQLLLMLALGAIFPEIEAEGLSSSLAVVFSLCTMYLVGFPVFYLAIRGMKKEEPSKRKCSAKTFVVTFVIATAFMYIGSSIGDLAVSLFDSVAGYTPVPNALELIKEIRWYEAFVAACLIGPFVEELMFRKLIIDRTRAYGEKLAIIFSALMFAFFHASLQQFFYAFLLGLLFGYFYVRKGNIWLCYLLHALFNFFGSVVPLLIMEKIDLEGLAASESPEELMDIAIANPTPIMLSGIYSLALIVMSLAGFAVLGKKIREIHYERTSLELPSDSEATVAFLNVGVIIFVLFSIAELIFEFV